MYPGRFEYAAPDSVAGAVDRLAAAVEAGEDARVLAGGHSLLPDLKRGAPAPDLLVDVGGLDDLRGVTVEGGTVAVGAATPYVDASRADAVRRSLPPLADALDAVGDRQVRNRGTVGGNLAQAEPGTDIPAPVLALGGRLAIRGPDGERATPLEPFYGESPLGPAEVLTGIEVPVPDAAGSYARREHPHTGYPLVGVAAVLEFDGDVVAEARVAATGATAARPAVRLRTTEREMVGTVPEPGSESDPGTREAAARASADAEAGTFENDVVSPAYREHLLVVCAERALTRAAERRRQRGG
jgi:carbon-monoxide dehydrogenase medium subunit